MDINDNICIWEQTEGNHYAWLTSCNNLFNLEDSTPEENGMKFCCFCGKPIREKLYYQ